MNTLKDYTDKIVVRYNLRGQNAAAKEIGISGASLSMFLAGKALPSEETMLKIADLAGMPKEEALIDLNLWRSSNNPEVAKIWQRMAKMINPAMVVFAFINMLQVLTIIAEMTYKNLYYV